MKRRPAPKSEIHLPSGAQALAAVVLAGGLLAFFSGVAPGSWNGGKAPFPFVWTDVAVVQFLCAVPLALVLSAVLMRRLGASAAVMVAAVLLGGSLVPLLGAVRPSLREAVVSSPPLGSALRAVLALGLTTALALLGTGLRGQRDVPPDAKARLPALLAGGLGIVALLLVPWTYTSARCRHDVAKLGEFLGASRFGEAHALAQGLLVLDARQEWQGRPLSEVAANIDRIVRALESRVAVPLPSQSTAAQRLERAQQLAMLGKTDAALEVSAWIRAPELTVDVENLRGTIHETRSEWEPALAAYRRAKETTSTTQAAGLLRATTGIAFCQRKLGRYAEAEATYQDVLALSPTADSHFLLAQFYEDAQQAEKARAHARQAMALAPAQYQHQGEKLIRKLSVYHFGCLGIYSDENDRANRPLTR